MASFKGNGLGVWEADRKFRDGKEVSETKWDNELIREKAQKYVEKYDIEMDQSKIVPEDEQLKEDIFNAGVDLLSDLGIYNIDTETVIEVTEEQIMAGLEKATTDLTLGKGKDSVEVTPRAGNDKKPPLTQGGPTGAPVSEDIFVEMHQTYAQEPSVDLIVDGVPSSYNGHDTPAGTAMEIKGTLFELRSVREACARAGRPNMGI
ncbi:MAG: Monomethylamine methyltransferase MtmB [Candidatus Methanohalarchaeum thermophilum]|uniref:[methylamine--corrinoid protein] Co-methyltransferase n=1 Tax=Methanohalarchaeum thermophilum TaxID=1903181 RepID=A0A1Q6DT64_METT1|nr:MAG: Monomethylamine methyltransferase MtmB [Candidatus Methanohalarchaeum thermophilum]